MCRVSTFCGCSLELGCKIIAIPELIAGGLGFIDALGEYVVAVFAWGMGIQSSLTIIAASFLLLGTLLVLNSYTHRYTCSVCRLRV